MSVRKFQHISKVAKREFSIPEKSDMLDNTSWGNDLSWQDIEYMARYFDVYELDPDTILMKEGQKCSAFMGLIITGTVLIIKEDTKGKHKILAKIPKGKTFGEMSLIDGLPSSAAVITEQSVLLMTLDSCKFDELTKENPRVANKFLLKLLKLVSARLRETSGKLVDFLEKE